MEINIKLIVMAAIAVFLIWILSYIIKTVNSLARLKNKATELNSDVDVALTKRYDLLKSSTVLFSCTVHTKVKLLLKQ